MTNQKRTFQHIVVGVDFSEYSQLVVKQARKLAKEFNAKLSLVYARGSWLIVSNAKAYGIPKEAQFETPQMEQSVRKFYRLKEEADISVIVQQGAPLDVISEVADDLANPLVVIGSHGTGAIGRFLLGSNAEQIALTSAFPVWVHRGSEVVSPKRALVPMDLSAKNKQALDALKAWFQESKISLESIFVRPTLPLGWEMGAYQQIFSLEKKTDQLIRRFQKAYPEISLKVVSGDPVQKINSVAGKYDFITMAPHNKYGANKLFGKVTTKIIRTAQKPILVLKPLRTALKHKQKKKSESRISTDLSPLAETQLHN
jgi:nucleotide-binding universal stress UspA family protein